MAVIQFTVWDAGTTVPRGAPIAQGVVPITGENISSGPIVTERRVAQVQIRADDDCWVSWWGPAKMDGSAGLMLFAGDTLTTEIKSGDQINVIQRIET